mmetsp:Transcript_78496/g.123819  ORF Transcript_78496/g.123819 Transcript_78496/m.123819 type:complete len:98 (-) Transcript_78496:1009-1302(-)
MKEQVQLKPAASEEAEDRIFPGKTSPIISHGTGPRPKEKKAMYPKEQTNANQPLFWKNWKKHASPRQQSNMPPQAVRSKNFRPAVSINGMETAVMST